MNLKKMFVFHHIPINHRSKGLDNSNISQSNLFVLCQKSTKELYVTLDIFNYDMQNKPNKQNTAGGVGGDGGSSSLGTSI